METLVLGVKVADSSYSAYPELRDHLEQQLREAFADRYGFPPEQMSWFYQSAEVVEDKEGKFTVPAHWMVLAEAIR